MQGETLLKKKTFDQLVSKCREESDITAAFEAVFGGTSCAVSLSTTKKRVYNPAPWGVQMTTYDFLEKGDDHV